MLDMEGVKFHQIEGTGREWIEYPTRNYVDKDPKAEGYFTLICADTLRKQPQLVQELKELYGAEVDVMEKWIRVEVVRNPLGKIVKHKSIVHNCMPPIVKDGFVHVLSFHSKDENYLNFIKWDVEKKLDERNKLSKFDIKTEEVKEEAVKEDDKKSVDIPDFLKNPNAQSVESSEFTQTPDGMEYKATYTSLDGVFKEMDEIMQNFFKGFPF